jgi:PII-like signaling protein
MIENDPSAKLLRIFIGESDRIGQQPLYEAIVFAAKKKSLSGATVTRGIMGFGANSKIHSSKLFDISSDLPLVIEIVDSEEKIMAFVEITEQLFEESGSGGLITIENIEVIRYKPGS